MVPDGACARVVLLLRAPLRATCVGADRDGASAHDLVGSAGRIARYNG